MKAQFNKNLKIMPKIVLYQPDIAGNVGTIIRSCVAFNCDLHIIEPCGFVFNLNKIKKSALDYLNFAKIYRHDSFEIFFNQEILRHQQIPANKMLLDQVAAADFHHLSLEKRN